MTHEHAHERTLREHLAILDALEHHSPDIAAARAAVHVAGVEEWLRDHVSPASPSEEADDD